MNKCIRPLLCLAMAAGQMHAQASGIAIDKVYTPYVEALEHELEYRAMRYEGGDTALDNVQKHKLAYGQAFSERWFGELYVMGTHPGNGDLDIDGYELEARWQVTEQGEYALDTGLLFELEHEENDDIWEISTALLLTREFGRVMATTNLYLIYENGNSIGSETETAANFQFLYRLSPHFEPAIEIYRAQDTFGIGPLISGTERLNSGKKLHWELGIIAGMLDDMPDTTIKGLIEYEF